MTLSFIRTALRVFILCPAIPFFFLAHLSFRELASVGFLPRKFKGLIRQKLQESSNRCAKSRQLYLVVVQYVVFIWADSHEYVTLQCEK